MTEQQTFDRVGSPDTKSETTTTVPMDVKPTDEVLVAEIPGWDESKGVVLTLSHPLNQNDRAYLGLPGGDGSTEVGQKVKVNKNGAKSLIGAGYATVDPEDQDAVRAAVSGVAAENAPAAAGTTDTTSGGVTPGLDPAPVTDPSLAVEPGQGDAEAPATTEPTASGDKAEADTSTSASRTSRKGTSS